jgi:DNA-binding NtrC family response regulator
VEPSTLPASALAADRDGVPAKPGLIVVFARGAAGARVMPLVGGALEIGRGDDGPGKLDDGRVSRRHARITRDAGGFTVTDLGSQNGTVADGRALVANAPTPLDRALRLGDSVLVPVADIGPYERYGVKTVDGFVRGPAMQATLAEVDSAAQAGSVLHVCGESGTGKEGIARAFHGAGPRGKGPLVAVNCAAIPSGLAERLLFGAKRGTYSGADQDAPGYLQDADGGTLFLDEIAELDAQVQAKLLRALESKEVLALGTSKPRKIEIGFCSATNKDLRALVAAGTVREDLYFRIGRPAVQLPALRNRPEEIAALVVRDLEAASLAPHVSLVEQCLLRAWPGNVRELLAELRTAAQAAAKDGDRVTAQHLAASAGSAFERATAEPAKKMPQVVDDDGRKRIEDALRANAGNVTATARALGLHRNQLRRLIERHGIAVGDLDDGE